MTLDGIALTLLWILAGAVGVIVVAFVGFWLFVAYLVATDPDRHFDDLY